jgi:hypothetical protein
MHLNNQYNYSITRKNMLENRMFLFLLLVSGTRQALHYYSVPQDPEGLFLQQPGTFWGGHEAHERKRIKRQETSEVTHIHKANHGTQREKKSNTPTNARATQYPRHLVRRKKIRKMTQSSKKSYKKRHRTPRPARLQGHHET